MRINARLLNSGATANSFEVKTFVTIHQGETTTLFFQFFDEDQDGLRYLPASGATTLVEIARFPEPFGTISNTREILDRSIRRAATQPFSGDGSVWSMPLTAVDTVTMMSSNIRITLTEGAVISKAFLAQAIKIIPQEGQP